MCEKCGGEGRILKLDPLDPDEVDLAEDTYQDYCACPAGKLVAEMDGAILDQQITDLKAKLRPNKSWDEVWELICNETPFAYCEWFVDGCEEASL